MELQAQLQALRDETHPTAQQVHWARVLAFGRGPQIREAIRGLRGG